MTGPEHYTEAERLLASSAELHTLAAEFASKGEAPPLAAIAMGQAVAEQAQVHATLALAAATAESSWGPVSAKWDTKGWIVR